MPVAVVGNKPKAFRFKPGIKLDWSCKERTALLAIHISHCMLSHHHHMDYLTNTAITHDLWTKGKKKNPQALSLISHSRKPSPLDVPALLEMLLAAWRQHTSRPLTSWKMHWTINHATSQNFYYWSGQVKTSNDSCHQIIFVSAHAPLQVKKTLKKRRKKKDNFLN